MNVNSSSNYPERAIKQLLAYTLVLQAKTEERLALR